MHSSKKSTDLPDGHAHRFDCRHVKSRDGKTAIELFLERIRNSEAPLRPFLTAANCLRLPTKHNADAGGDCETG